MKDLCNNSYERMDEITPIIEQKKVTSIMDLYRLLPKTNCKKCSYPDEPCHHPEKAAPCLFSHGINVIKLWETSGYPTGKLDEFDSYALILYDKK